MHQLSRQRLPLPASRAAQDVYQDYFAWLRSYTLGLVRVTGGEKGTWCIRLLGVPLIRLQAQAGADPRRVDLHVTGGLIARPGGVFRFERAQAELIVTLEDYRTRLPRWLYRRTQARLHEVIMERYRRDLVRRAA